MQYQVSMIKINGIWQSVLVISSDTKQTFEKTIIQKEPNITTTYHTDGLYKEIEENGVYYYWFIIRSKETVITNEELIAQYEEALNVLGVETEETNAE